MRDGEMGKKKKGTNRKMTEKTGEFSAEMELIAGKILQEGKGKGSEMWESRKSFFFRTCLNQEIGKGKRSDRTKRKRKENRGRERQELKRRETPPGERVQSLLGSPRPFSGHLLA